MCRICVESGAGDSFMAALRDRGRVVDGQRHTRGRNGGDRDVDRPYRGQRHSRLLLALLDRAGLSRPRVNVRVAGFEVDAHWPDDRLVVEVDAYGTHGSRAAFERDRVRDARLQTTGLRVIRVTWRQLTETPEAVVATLAPWLSPRPDG